MTVCVEEHIPVRDRPYETPPVSWNRFARGLDGRLSHAGSSLLSRGTLLQRELSRLSSHFGTCFSDEEQLTDLLVTASA